MKYVYCANCGTKLKITRKALPRYGKIIDIVECHECLESPVDLDLKPTDVPRVSSSERRSGERSSENKFVQKLNELVRKSLPLELRSMELRSRNETREFEKLSETKNYEHERPLPSSVRTIPSTAPRTLLDSIRVNKVSEETDG